MLRPGHTSLHSDAWHRAIVELNTPAKPQVCHFCQWPGSILTVCMVCSSMIAALSHRPNRYWLDAADADGIKKHLRKQEEGPLGFTDVDL